MIKYLRAPLMFLLYPLLQGFINWLCTMIDPYNKHAFYHSLNFYMPLNQATKLRPVMIYDDKKTKCLPTWEKIS